MDQELSLKKKLERVLKKDVSLDKYIKKLKGLKQIDLLIPFNDTEITLLMYFVKMNQKAYVAYLLKEPQPASRTIQSSMHINALMLAILTACENKQYDLSIIDLLLQEQAEEQLMVESKVGNALFLAVLYNRLDLVRKLLATSCKKQVFMGTKHLPIYEAIAQEQWLTVIELLKYYPEEQLLTLHPEQKLPIHDLIRSGNFPLVKYALKFQGEKQLKQLRSDKTTVFEFAAVSENLALVEWLMDEYPFILEQRGLDEFSPLQYACKLMNLLLIKLVLKKAPHQALLKDNENMKAVQTFLMGFSLIKNKITDFGEYIEIFKLLLKGDFKQRLEEKQFNQNIFHTLCLCSHFMQEHIFKLFEIAFEYGEKEVNDLTPFLTSISPLISNTPLIFFIEIEMEAPLRLQLIQLFLSKNKLEQLYTPNKNGVIPVEVAISQNALAIVKTLLQFAPQKQLAARGKFSPLTFAIIFERKEIMEYLLPFYSEALILDIIEKGEPVMHLASLPMLKVLFQAPFASLLVNAKEKEFGSTPLHIAIDQADDETIDFLLAHKADIFLKDKKEWDALSIACFKGKLNLVKKLLSLGINPEVSNGALFSCIHIAARYGYLEIIKELVKHGAKINLEKQIITPLLAAIFFKHMHIVEFLLAHKEDPNVSIKQKTYQLSPLFLAVQQLNFKLIKLLLSYKAEKNPIIYQKENIIITLMDWIQIKFKNQATIQAKFKAIFQHEFAEEKSITIYPEDQSILKSHHYLSLLGYTEEEIKLFNLERKAKKKYLTEKKHHQFFSDNKNTSVTWLDGKIKSEAPFIHLSTAPGQSTVYYYWDEENLTAQGCDKNLFLHKRLKFDGYHCSQLDDKKATYFDSVELWPNTPSEKIKYDYEFKINQVDRILFFKLIADDKKTPLYIGIKYVPWGFHTYGDLYSFKTGLKTSTKETSLKISWPIFEKTSYLNTTFK